MLVVALTAVALTGATWELDASHTNASFSVRHMMVSDVRGDMGPVTATFEFDEKDPAKNKLEAKVDVTKVNTRHEKRDEHLRSPDFFDAAKYPAMSFKSKKWEKAGDNAWKVTGDLTIKDKTKEVTMNVTSTPEQKDLWTKAPVRGFAATTTLNREDWGLNWNKALETGGVLVGKEVKVTIDAEFKKMEAPATKTASPAPKK